MYLLFLTSFVLLFLSSIFGNRGNEKYVKDDFLLLAFLTLSGIAINSVVTGSMIFPQPRYMCYGMGLFYLALTCDIRATKK